ncbi:MAG: ABC transporter permease, partial [Candidatus Binatia bacterium]
MRLFKPDSPVVHYQDQGVAALPFIRIAPSRGWRSPRLGELLEYRELLYFLIWRDLKVRYKQTIIGVAWAVLQPLATMIIFTVIFGYLVQVPSDGFPYSLFAYSALLPWTYFSSALNRAVNSVVGDSNLISKVYFPRLILPTAGVLSGLVDFAITFVVLLVLLVWFATVPTWRILILPLFLLLAVVTSLAVGLWLSALNVMYR